MDSTSNGPLYICINKCGWESDDPRELPPNNACPNCGSEVEIRMSHGKACDFCSEPDPAWVFDSVPFTAPPLSIKEIGGHPLPEQRSERGWAACDTCADLIDECDPEGTGHVRSADTFLALHKRSNESFKQKYGGKFPSWLEEELDDQRIRLHKKFFMHKRSGRIKANEFGSYVTDNPIVMPEPSLYHHRMEGRRPWSEALRMRNLMQDWWATIQGKRYGESFSNTSGLKVGVVGMPYEGQMHDLAQQQRMALGHSDIYWVSPDMTQMAWAAHKSMPPRPITQEVIPSHHGFVLFQDSLHYPDSHGKLIGTRAVLWSSTVDADTREVGVLLAFYTDTKRDKSDYAYAELQGYQSLGLPELLLSHITFWPYDMSVDDYLHKLKVTDVPGNIAAQLQFMLAFWTISQQPLVAMTHRPADRHVRRQLSRKKLEVPDVRVITLRREQAIGLEHDPDPEGHRANYSHRFMVSGHWRHQRVGEKRGQTRLVWVNEYIKGPEDKPLVLKQKIFRVVR